MLGFSTVLLVALAVTVSSVPHHHDDSVELRFKLSARDLPLSHLLTEKPFIKISAEDDDNNDEYHIGETNTVEETNNPDFPNVFDFRYQPSKHQRLHFKVRGSEAINDDAHIGEAWVTVSDYVNKDGYMEINLNNKGYIIMKSA